MAVRAEHAGQLAGLVLGPVQIAGDIMPRKTFQVDALDGVIVAVDSAMHDGMGRRFGRHRPQAQPTRAWRRTSSARFAQASLVLGGVNGK